MSVQEALALAQADPALSIPAPDPIGRLYRYPDSEPLPTGPNGGIILPSEEEVLANVRNGYWLPSITNVLGVVGQEHLVGWAARKATRTAIEIVNKHPESITRNPAGALRYISTAHTRDRDNAARQGTQVHYAAELLSVGKEVPEGLLNSKERGYVAQWQRWADTFQPEFLHLESTVYGKAGGLPYAGTTDFICKINGIVVGGDLKTTRSGISSSVAYQLSAVRHADSLAVDTSKLVDMPTLDATYVLHLTEHDYTFAPLWTTGETWDSFKSMRQLWDGWVLGGSTLSGHALVQPATTSPDQVLPL